MIALGALRALLWKLWREYRLLVIFLLAATATAMVNYRRAGPDARATLMIAVAFLTPPLVAWRTLLSEDRAPAALAALPVSPALAWGLKILAGILIAAAPFLLISLTQGFPAPPFPVPMPSLAMILLAAILLYLWILLFARRDRSDAAIVVKTLVVLIANFFLAHVAAAPGNAELLLAQFVPFGFVVRPFRYADLAFTAAFALALFFLACRVLPGRTSPAAPRRSLPSSLADWNVSLWEIPGQRAAVLWKAWRDVRTLACAGPLATFAASFALATMMSGLAAPFVLAEWLDEARFAVPYLGRFLSVFYALALGAVLTCADGHATARFLAATPVPRRIWFWTRYRLGLAVIVAATLVVILAYSLLPPPRSQVNRADDWFEALVFFLILQWFAYTVAIFLGTLIRRASLTFLAGCAFFIASGSLLTFLGLDGADRLAGAMFASTLVLLAAFLVQYRVDIPDLLIRGKKSVLKNAPASKTDQ